jgi:hypothetical protein
MKAKNIVIGQELEARVINANYSNHSVEVEVLEGNAKGKYFIVEKSDLIKEVKMTVAKLVKMAKAEMIKEGYTVTDLENNCLCELVQETNKTITEASEELVKITSKEWSLMDRNNNPYGEYDTIDQAKHSILHDVVSYIIEGNNTTVLQLKKKILKNIIGE